MMWLRNMRLALARWIEPSRSVVNLEQHIIYSVSDSLSQEDAFRLILQIRRGGTTTETDVRTTNYVEVQPVTREYNLH